MNPANANLVPAAAEEGTAVIAASPLHGGLLGSTRDHWKEKGRFSDLYDRLERLESLLADEPEGIEGTAIRYLLSDERVSMVLCGVADLDELELCVSISDGRGLPEGLIHEIEGMGL